jgi:hypothetical protein
MARVAPKHVFADVTHHDDGLLTGAEVEAELIERGLPLDLLQSRHGRIGLYAII